MARWTRSRVSGLTLSNPRATRDTVCIETPAASATAAIDGARRGAVRSVDNVFPPFDFPER